MRRIELTISNLLAEVQRLTSDNNRLRIEVAGLQAQVDKLERAVDAKSLYRQRPDFADKG